MATVGLDYSNDALKLSKDAIARCSEPRIPAFLLRADAKFLPLKEGLFDVVFMLDVVEHLLPWELGECLDEVFRILKASGVAIIHTDPNRWRKWVYPIKKLAGPRLFGVAAAKKDAVCKALHVNEQSPISLGRTLRSAGFRYRLWVEAGELKSLASRGLAGRIVLNIVNKSFLTILGNEIWAIARKPQRAQKADKRRTSSVSRF
jgi:SAM-dependent methyltransferase